MIRACGCTYRANPFVQVDEQEARDLTAILLFHLDDGRTPTWGDLCNAMRANTDEKRDKLHQVLHLIATPHITPERGPGRKGTRWKLLSG